MKKTKVIILSLLTALVSLVLLLLVILGPFISLYGIQASLDSGQHKKLERYIDFPTLQENVKIKIIAQTQQAFGFEFSEGNNMLANFAKQFAQQIIDLAVENAISPSGIAMMLSGQDLNEIIMGTKQQNNESHTHTTQSEEPQKKTLVEMYKESHFTYEDHKTFIFYLPNKENINEHSGKLIFSRRGVVWKLSDIEFAP